MEINIRDSDATDATDGDNDSTKMRASPQKGTQSNELASASGDDPDPDVDNLDDLDDLDDMLDEFCMSKTENSVLGSSISQPAQSESRPEVLLDDEFEKRLQAEIAGLLSNSEMPPNLITDFEKMLKEMVQVTTQEEKAGASNPSSTSNAPPDQKLKPVSLTNQSGPDESFQNTIKKTMERMAASRDQATAATTSESSDNFLADILKAMQSSGLDGEADGEEDFSKVLLGMMEQLTNKDILYEPMKELDDKFPEWMEKNAEKVGDADLIRYREQQVYVREIVQRFESKTYTDETEADKEYIVERMQKMQAAGSPPVDLVGDMAKAQEIFGAAQDGCPMQ